MEHLKIIEYFPKRIASSIKNITFEDVEEIRLRIGQMIEVCAGKHNLFLPCEGSDDHITLADCREFLERICFHSVYACEPQLRAGYITLPGGFRIGFAGKVLQENSRILRVDEPVSFCIRIARECIGCSEPVMHYLVNDENIPLSTLIISPPGCGKTTLLRDIARNFSSNVYGGLTSSVCVVDERSEIAGCWNGIPQLDLGPRCDVLDNCPKSEGILLALRALAPNVIVCDELGTDADAAAVGKALSCGCAVVATLHGNSPEALHTRFSESVSGVFSRYLLLSRRNGPGTIEGIFDENGRIISDGVW